MVNNVYMSAVKGAYIIPEVTIIGSAVPPTPLIPPGVDQLRRKKTCRRAGMWHFVGDGETNVASPQIGKEVIHLSNLICLNDATRLGWPANAPVKFKIISPSYFVATSQEEINAIMSFKIEANYIIPSGVGFLADAEYPPPPNSALLAGTTYTNDLKIIVSSSVNGTLKGGVKFHWMCLVEFGILGNIGG